MEGDKLNEKLVSHVEIKYRDGVDLNMYQCGIEECSSGYGFGPALRDHFLIHYILGGSGRFYIDDKEYKLTKGQGFLIPPNVITYYEADIDTPWTYVWVGFHGLKAESYLQQANLTINSPVFKCDSEALKDYVFQMIESNKFSTYNNLKLQGLLFLFIAELIKVAPKDTVTQYNSAEIYIKEAIKFIENNYSRGIKVEDIAKHLSIDRSYFSNIFKAKLQKSPQEFLLEYRINRACELMEQSDLSIKHIAHSIGYIDALSFSKMFKKIKGISPTKWRKQI